VFVCDHDITMMLSIYKFLVNFLQLSERKKVAIGKKWVFLFKKWVFLFKKLGLNHHITRKKNPSITFR